MIQNLAQVPGAPKSPGHLLWFAELVKRIAAKIEELRKDGVVGIGRECLMAGVKVPVGVNFRPSKQNHAA